MRLLQTEMKPKALGYLRHNPAALVADGINISTHLCPLLCDLWGNSALQNEMAYKSSTTSGKQLKVHPFTIMSQ